MEIEVKELDQCKLLVNYVGDAEEILNARSKVLTQFKNAPVKGFRKGHASMEAIKVYYRDQINQSVKQLMAENAFHNTLFEKKLRNHGAPRFNSLSLDGGKFTCEFEMYTKPDFELAEFRGLEIPKPEHDENANEVAELMLQDLRTRFGEVIPYSDTDFVQFGDNVIIDYDGFLDGEKVENLSATGETLVVGKSQLPVFDSNLLGMKCGETHEFEMKVPESGLPSLAGKAVTIKATLVIGSKTTPAALDDELAHKVGKKDYAELRDAAYAQAAAKVANDYQTKFNDAVARRLLSDNDIVVPNWLSLSEAQYLANQSKLDWNAISDEDKERFISVGEQNVKLSLILDRIREDEPEAQLSDQEVFEIIKQNLSRTQVKTPIDEVIKEMNRTGYMQILFSRIKDEYALSFVIKSAKAIE